MSNPLSSHNLDSIEDVLVRGVRNHMLQCGFSQCHLGLSGGLDSALVAYLAVQAVGKENVTCFILPSRFTSQGSLDDAQNMANNLGCPNETLSIEPLYVCFLETLKKTFEGCAFDTTEENLQSRIRGTLLMAFSNKFKSMLLATGNKSELAMGYCTLYGDMNGGLAPIGELFKTEVFALCRRINEKCRLQPDNNAIPINVFPETILTKPPSAELRFNQTDQDSLPPYEILDAILEQYLRKNRQADEIAAILKFDRELIDSIIKSIESATFKRRQAPPVLHI